MANYYGVARTSYVKVKDPEAFKEAMSQYPVEVVEKDGAYGLLDRHPDGGGWDWTPWWGVEESDPDDADDPVALIAPHMQDDQVMIMVEVGHEKYRYVNAYALVFNAKGVCKTVNLSDAAHELAKSLGGNFTHPSY